MKPRILAFASTIVISLAAPLHADTYNWNGSTTGGGTGASNTWDTVTANWTGFDTTWPSFSTGDDDAVFGGTVGTVTLGTAVSANEITFSAGNFTIGADNTPGSITLDGTDPRITSSAGTLNSIGAVIQGSAGLTKSGSVTLQLRGASTYTGDTRVLRGNLLIGLGNNRLPTGTKLILGDGNTNTSGVFQMNSRSQQVAGLETAGAGTANRVINSNAATSTFTVNNAADSTYDGFLGGATANDNNFNLAKLGLGVLVLTNNNTHTGTTTVGVSRSSGPTYVSNGSLRLAHHHAAGSGTIVINGGYEAGRIELSGGVEVSNAVTLEGRQGPTWPAIVNQSGDNTLSGTINIIANGTRLIFRTDAGKITVSGPAMTGASGRVLTLRGTAEGEFAKNLTSSVIGSVDKKDAGTWTLSGVNTYTGDTSAEGTLIFSSTSSTRFYPKADASSNKITGGGATLSLDGALDIDLTNAASAPDSTSWLLVDVDNLDETFGDNFSVAGFTEGPAGTWTRTVFPSTYTFTENNGRLVKTAATATPFEDWMSTHFPGLATPDNLPGADPDGDGVNNLAEFAFAGDPTDGANNGIFRFGIDNVGGTDHLTYTFACRDGATFTGGAPANASKDGVDYSVRASLDLSVFNLGVDEVSPAIVTGLATAPTGYSYRTFRVVDPKATHPQAFIQVKTVLSAP